VVYLNYRKDVLLLNYCSTNTNDIIQIITYVKHIHGYDPVGKIAKKQSEGQCHIVKNALLQTAFSAFDFAQWGYAL